MLDPGQAGRPVHRIIGSPVQLEEEELPSSDSSSSHSESAETQSQTASSKKEKHLAYVAALKEYRVYGVIQPFLFLKLLVGYNLLVSALTWHWILEIPDYLKLPEDYANEPYYLQEMVRDDLGVIVTEYFILNTVGSILIFLAIFDQRSSNMRYLTLATKLMWITQAFYDFSIFIDLLYPLKNRGMWITRFLGLFIVNFGVFFLGHLACSELQVYEKTKVRNLPAKHLERRDRRCICCVPLRVGAPLFAFLMSVLSLLILCSYVGDTNDPDFSLFVKVSTPMVLVSFVLFMRFILDYQGAWRSLPFGMALLVLQIAVLAIFFSEQSNGNPWEFWQGYLLGLLFILIVGYYFVDIFKRYCLMVEQARSH